MHRLSKSKRAVGLVSAVVVVTLGCALWLEGSRQPHYHGSPLARYLAAFASARMTVADSPPFGPVMEVPGGFSGPLPWVARSVYAAAFWAVAPHPEPGRWAVGFRFAGIPDEFLGLGLGRQACAPNRRGRACDVADQCARRDSLQGPVGFPPAEMDSRRPERPRPGTPLMILMRRTDLFVFRRPPA
jgi:hypothetical protein